jgi:hypothetical protein
MSEQDFIEKMAADPSPSAKAALRAIGFLKRHSTTAGSVVGGLGAFGLGYMHNRKRKGEELTPEQKAAKERLKKALTGIKKEKSFWTGLEATKAKSHIDVANLMAKHPFKGALLAVPIGASAGAGVVNSAKWLAKLK